MWTQTAVLENTDEAEAFMDLDGYRPVWSLPDGDIFLDEQTDDDGDYASGWVDVGEIDVEWGEPGEVADALAEAIETAGLEGYRVITAWPGSHYIQRRVGDD